MNALPAIEPLPTFASDHTAEPNELRGRCSNRVCYAPMTSATGERAYGYFVANSDALAEAVFNQVPIPERESQDSWEELFYRWLRDCNRHDQELTMLSHEWQGVETAVEHAFLRGRAHVFCLGCNRIYWQPQVHHARQSLPGFRGTQRYECPHGHMLLSPLDANIAPLPVCAA